MSEVAPFVMSISLNTLNHLGINLYSNVPAVLSELVANAYDADATEVRISVKADEIVIADNGSGMTKTGINERYLTIGYSRRSKQPGLTPLGRAPMGRKGIGKLAVFSIAETVEVYSRSEGESNGLKLSRQAIQGLIKKENSTANQNDAEVQRVYLPEPISAEHIDFPHGTVLVLRDLRRKRDATFAVDNLRKKLARRFTVIGARHNFRIYINEEEVTPRDRGFYPSMEFIWFFGAVDQEIVDECKSLKHHHVLTDIVDEEADFRVQGWIGTVGEPKELGDRSEEGNSIVIYARGKLVQENILQEIREARVFAQYIVGDVQADFIDLDDADDLATSDRQRLVADDPRYQQLKKRIEDAIKAIGLQWTDLRRDEGSKRALDNPIIKRWYDDLSSDNKKYAKKLFGKIESLPVSSSRTKAELYKGSILAFEKMALTDQLSILDEISTDEGLEALLTIFRSVDELEAVHYFEIARGRLQVIKKFAGLVDSDAKERVLQQYLFEHLWLLDPSWDRATGTERLEQSVTREFDTVTASLTEEERTGRIDIRYRTFAGKHIVVEMKRHSVLADVYELSQQISKYINALKKVLAAQFPDKKDWQIETICVLGFAPVGAEPDVVTKILAANSARFVTYDQLIQGAEMAYAEYLEREKRVSKITAILEELDRVSQIEFSETD